MSKAVLISIKPKWVEKIINGKKTIEVRKTAPKLETPFKVYVYCTYGNEKENYMLGKTGKVVAEFTCAKIYKVENKGSYFSIENDIAMTNGVAKRSCLDFDDMKSYLGKKGGYAWEIEDLKVYDEPKELSKFDYYCDKEKTKYGEGRKCYICDHQALSIEVIDGQLQAEHYCEIKLTRPPQSYCYVEEI